MITLKRGEKSPVKEPLEQNFEDFRQAVLTAIELLKDPDDEFTITVSEDDKPCKRFIHRKNYWAHGIKTCNWDRYTHKEDFKKPYIRQRPKGSLTYIVMCYHGEMAVKMPWIGVHPNQAEVQELCEHYNRTHGGIDDKA